MPRVLFVCLGNICRSPTAEGVVRRHLAERAPQFEIELDSAGTHAYHVGEAPDARAVEAAMRRGIDISGLRARRVAPEDFERFDLILAMDAANLAELRRMAPPGARARLRLMLEYAPDAALEEVPDPYYGGTAGFEQVLDLLEDAAEGLARALAESAAGRSLT